MGRWKNACVMLFLGLFIFCTGQHVSAAFDLGISRTTYDSNTGILTIYDAAFHDTEFRANVSKMKLGNVSLTGSYEFQAGSLRVFLRNKDAVNGQQGFTENQTVQGGLHLEYGAIINSYRPPNSINVVIDSPSREANPNVAVSGLRPNMVIESFTANPATLSSSGGKVTLTVTGDHLDRASFQAHDLNSTVKYQLNASKTSATVQIIRPENSMQVSRVDTYVLYIDGRETTQRVSVTVLPNTIESSVESSSSSNPELSGSAPQTDHSSKGSQGTIAENSSGSSKNDKTTESAGSESNTAIDNSSSSTAQGDPAENSRSSSEDTSQENSQLSSKQSKEHRKESGGKIGLPAAIASLLVIAAGGIGLYFKFFHKKGGR